MYDSYKYREARRQIRALLDDGQIGTAFQAVNRHLEANRGDPNALLIKGKILRRWGRYGESEEILLEAQLGFHPGSAWLVFAELGHLYDRWGRLEMALANYEKIVVLFPGQIWGHIWRGHTLGFLARHEEAAESYARATLCSKGDTSWAHYFLGLIRRAQERHEEARQCFWTALQIDPDYGMAAAALADMESVLRRPRHLRLV